MKNHYAQYMTEEGIIYYKAWNYSQALLCWQDAAAQGSLGAMFNLGVFWLQKASNQNELLLAKEWMEKANFAGHPSAGLQINKINDMLKNGTFFKENLNQSAMRISRVFHKIKLGDYAFIILYEDREQLLCLSEHIVAIRPYHELREPVTWENCSLRKWLNSTFLDTFSEPERSLIIVRNSININNDTYGTSGGKDTEDNIFLLSYAEIQKYLSIREDSAPKHDNVDLLKQCSDDALRIASLQIKHPNLNSTRDELQHNYSLLEGLPVGWWLRSPGSTSCRAMRVNCHGTIRLYGREVDSSLVGVRPAIRLKRCEINYERYIDCVSF